MGLCVLSDEAMRRVPDADLLNGTLAFLLQVRDAAELHGRVTSYNFSHFTLFDLARLPAHSPPRPNSAQLPNAHLWKEIQIALSLIPLCYFYLFGHVLLPQFSILVVVLHPTSMFSIMLHLPSQSTPSNHTTK